MIGLVGTLLLLTQPQENTPPGAPLRSDSPPSRELTPANELFFEDERAPLSAAAREKLQAFGRCAAARSPDMAAGTLTMNFTTNAYRNRLSQLSRNNEGCLEGARRMRAGGPRVRLSRGAAGDSPPRRRGRPQPGT